MKQNPNNLSEKPSEVQYPKTTNNRKAGVIKGFKKISPAV